MSNRIGKGAVLNRTEMARHLGIAMPTLDDWVRRGCPVVSRGGRGRQWAFNSADVRAWRDDDIRRDMAGQDDASIEELKKRKLRAETLQAELDLSRLRDELVPAEQFDRAMAKAFGEVQANMRNVLPGRAARRLIGETDETRFKEVLLEEVDQALSALADDDLITEADLEIDEEDDDADEAE